MISQQIALFLLLASSAYFFIMKVDINLVFIPLIASIAYYFMIRDPKNSEKYRYAEWAITTPLMLYGILKANGVPISVTLSIILLDLLMIGSAVLGMSGQADFWFIPGMLFFLPILYFIFHLDKYKPAIYLTTLIWALYPLIWIMEKDRVLTKNDTSTAFSVLDTISKIGLVDLLM
jgi:bacteriorhodopsin